MEKWYSVRCQPRYVDRVKNNLCQLGLDVYHPTYIVHIAEPISRQSRPARIRLEPLFIGVIFVRFDPDEFDMSNILNINGVFHRQSPKVLPDSFIESIHRAIKKDN